MLEINKPTEKEAFKFKNSSVNIGNNYARKAPKKE